MSEVYGNAFWYEEPETVSPPTSGTLEKVAEIRMSRYLTSLLIIGIKNESSVRARVKLTRALSEIGAEETVLFVTLEPEAVIYRKLTGIFTYNIYSDQTIKLKVMPLDSQQHIREELTLPFEILARDTDRSIAAGGTIYIPDSDGVDISRHRLKTVSVVADYALDVDIEVSDDGSKWYSYYSDTLTANKLWSKSFEEDYMYLRLKLVNSDTSDHTIDMVTVKGR